MKEKFEIKPEEERPKSVPKATVGIAVGEFLSNSESVRKASNYLAVGFQRFCKFNNVPYNQPLEAWEKLFKNFCDGGK